MRGESAMHVTGRTGEALPSWRHEALRPMLTIGAIVAPIAALATIVGRPPPRRLLDAVVVGAVGLAVPLLRLWPGRFAVRTALTMMLFYGVSVFVLATNGLVPGATLLFALTSVFGAIYFGRAVAFTMVLLGGLAFVGVGWAVTNAAVDVPADLLDTRLLVNWVRVGMVFASIGTLLTSGVAFVIGRVEATARDLRVAYERLGLLHLRLESAKEEERRFLAHELHDELGQLLTALKMRLQTVARRGSQGDADAIGMIDDMIARVRRMSGDLRPPLLDESGLVPALRAFIDGQAALSGVAMTLEVEEEDDAPPLGRDVEITCFRVVQEAVTNALRHAEPRALRVRIDRRRDRVALRVHDDGRGFDVAVRLEGAAADGHLGVVGMRERVRAHGGGFRLSSRPGGGTTIEVDLPLVPPPLSSPAAVLS
jgi:signal transduction histidine kinase